MSDEVTTNEAVETATKTSIELTGDAAKIMDLVKGLSAIDLNQLVKALEEEFGVSAAAPVMMWGGWGSGDDAGWGDDTITVQLSEVGQSKIAVIKVVKEILGLGLKEAKDLVGQAPVVLKEKIESDEAESIKAKLEEVGATVAFK
jgi:large subunit ribosomal protein L7/L12